MTLAIKKAKEYFNNGDFEKAIAIYQGAVKEDVHQIWAYQGLAQCFLQLRRFDDAEQTLEKALLLDPHQVDLHIALSKVHSSAGNFHKSVSVLRDAVNLAPSNWMVHYNLAVDLLLMKLDREALKEFRIAYQLYPSKKTATSLLAVNISLNRLWYTVLIVLLYLFSIQTRSIYALPLILISSGYCFVGSYLWFIAKDSRKALIDLFIGIFVLASYFSYLFVRI